MKTYTIKSKVTGSILWERATYSHDIDRRGGDYRTVVFKGEDREEIHAHAKGDKYIHFDVEPSKPKDEAKVLFKKGSPVPAGWQLV